MYPCLHHHNDRDHLLYYVHSSRVFRALERLGVLSRRIKWTSHYLGAAFVYFAIGRPAVVIAILIERASFMPQIPQSLLEINWADPRKDAAVAVLDHPSRVKAGDQCKEGHDFNLQRKQQRAVLFVNVTPLITCGEATQVKGSGFMRT